eukprot:356543-Chlamydomonas_euryale.AAC.12
MRRLSNCTAAWCVPRRGRSGVTTPTRWRTPRRWRSCCRRWAGRTTRTRWSRRSSRRPVRRRERASAQRAGQGDLQGGLSGGARGVPAQ